MSKKILGLDIKNDAASAVLITSGIKENRIDAHAYVSISDKETIGTGIAGLLETISESGDITDAVCIVSFFTDQISFRNIRVPFRQHKKIRQVIAFELEPTLPFQIDELIIDYRPVTVSDQTDNTKIIAAAVQKSALKSYLGILASCKIEPEIVTVGSYPAALGIVMFSDIAENTLIIDISVEKSSVFAVISGQICGIRSLPSGLTDNLPEQSDNPDDSPIDCLEIKSLCSNIKRTIFAFSEIINVDFKPTQILVTGWNNTKFDFRQKMEELLGIPVKLADLIHEAGFKIKNQTSMPWKPGRMNNALALAMLEITGADCINFRKDSFAVNKYRLQHKKAMTISFVIAAFVLISIFISIFCDSYALKKKVSALDNRITGIFKTAFPDVKRIVDPLQQMRVKTDAIKKKSMFSGKTGNNVLVIDIIDGISKAIPENIDVALTGLVISPENMVVSGDTKTFNFVDDMKSRLEKIKIFKKVTISSANIDRSGNRVRFKLKIEL